jgi:hypothetical protein
VGYRRNRTVPLVFTGELADFTATARVATIDEWFDACDIVLAGIAYVPSNRERITQITTQVVESITEWNLEGEDGEPLPVTVEAFKAQDRWWQATVINGWLDQMAQVSDPLEMPSSSGEASELADLPMTEPDPASLAS